MAKHKWHLLGCFLGIALTCYFLYHTISGDKGWITQARLQDQIALTEQKLAQLRHEHEALEHRVHLMRPDSMDPDLLDEESRKTLNYSKPGEVIILSQPEEPSAKQ